MHWGSPKPPLHFEVYWNVKLPLDEDFPRLRKPQLLINQAKRCREEFELGWMFFQCYKFYFDADWRLASFWSSLSFFSISKPTFPWNGCEEWNTISLLWTLSKGWVLWIKMNTSCTLLPDSNTCPSKILPAFEETKHHSDLNRWLCVSLAVSGVIQSFS